jgi:hypothetical protein
MGNALPRFGFAPRLEGRGRGRFCPDKLRTDARTKPPRVSAGWLLPAGCWLLSVVCFYLTGGSHRRADQLAPTLAEAARAQQVRCIIDTPAIRKTNI